MISISSYAKNHNINLRTIYSKFNKSELDFLLVLDFVEKSNISEDQIKALFNLKNKEIEEDAFFFYFQSEKILNIKIKVNIIKDDKLFLAYLLNKLNPTKEELIFLLKLIKETQ